MNSKSIPIWIQTNSDSTGKVEKKTNRGWGLGEADVHKDGPVEEAQEIGEHRELVEEHAEHHPDCGGWGMASIRKSSENIDFKFPNIFSKKNSEIFRN